MPRSRRRSLKDSVGTGGIQTSCLNRSSSHQEEPYRRTDIGTPEVHPKLSEEEMADAPASPAYIFPPIPTPGEVEARFSSLLKQMDLAPDKAKVLKSYDLKKKWEIVCDQEKVEDRGAPSLYLGKLREFLDPKAAKKRRRSCAIETSTTILKHLETSLRTNSIDWVKAFLEENSGLDVLVTYLANVQSSGAFQLPQSMITENNDPLNNASYSTSGYSSMPTVSSVEQLRAGEFRRNKLARSGRFSYVAISLDPAADVHVCIQCLRAIMNNKHGFNQVFAHPEAIYCIVRSLLNPNQRTKALALELLAAICLVKGGHDLITHAFDRFQQQYSERLRFGTLFYMFEHFGHFHLDFMVACMQFINIVVHSVDSMNYRIFLQYEFTRLGLDEFLEKLKLMESEQLDVHISAYLDNMFDVGSLMEDAEQKTAALERASEVELDLSRATERVQEIEAEYMMRLVQLDNRLADLVKERDNLVSLNQQTDTEVNTLRKVLSKKDFEAKSLESRIKDLEELQKSLKPSLSSPSKGVARIPTSAGSASPARESPSTDPVIATPAPPPPPPLPAGIPPPPPPPSFPKTGGIPPAPALPSGQDPNVMTIKRKIRTRCCLPVLNWMPLKPNQVRGTVFNELDDDKIIDLIDFSSFEQNFQIGVNPDVAVSHHVKSANENTAAPVGLVGSPRIGGKKERPQSLLGQKRLQNLAITKRKLAMEPHEIAIAINSLDTARLCAENVEILLPLVPTMDEVKAYKDYESMLRPIESLGEEDRLMFQLCKVERLKQKLEIMSFIGNFSEMANLINPSINIITAASRSTKDAKKFHKVLEVVLAFGNYMNSAKRGGVYGFKLQSLDSLMYLRSPSNKDVTLLHAIADIIRVKFSNLLDFADELKLLEKASLVALESVLMDVSELERGMELAKKEQALRGPDAKNPTLAQFLTENESRLEQLKSNAKAANEAFQDCATFYGESGKTINTAMFFKTIHNFVKHFKVAGEENIARKKIEEAQDQAVPASTVERTNRPKSLKALQADVISELEKRGNKQLTRERSVISKLPKNAIYDGALEDIIADMKESPYVSQDAVRRKSFKRDRGISQGLLSKPQNIADGTSV